MRETAEGLSLPNSSSAAALSILRVDSPSLYTSAIAPTIARSVRE